MDNFNEMYKSICRVCLLQKKCENMVSLTDNSRDDGLSCFGKSISILTNVSLQNGDKLPYMMCQDCVYLLKQAIYFKFKCESSDRKLKVIVNEILNKSDSVQDIEEILGQYVLFNRYYPPEITRNCSTKNYERKSVITPKKISQEINVINEIGSDGSIALQDDFTWEEEENIDKSNNFHDTESSEPEIVLEKLQNILDVGLEYGINLSNKEAKKKSNQKRYLTCNICQLALKNEDNFNRHLKIHKEILDRKPRSIRRKINMGENNSKSKLNDGFNINIVSINTYQEIIKPSSGIGIKLDNIQSKIDSNLPNKSKKTYKRRNKKQNLTCNVCNRVLANSVTYNQHMQRHNQYIHICETCGKGYPALGSLQRHQIVKHGYGPYLMCDHCSFKAPNKVSLIEHLRLHTGERPFTCEKCGLSFRRRAIWRNHLSCHMEKNYQCLYCHKKFRNNRLLKCHSNNVHKRMFMFKCTFCDALYAKNCTVRKHMASKHGVPREMQGKIMKVTSNFPVSKSLIPIV